MARSARRAARGAARHPLSVAVVVVLWVWILIDLPQITEMASRSRW
jgi:hypothetical protein